MWGWAIIPYFNILIFIGVVDNNIWYNSSVGQNVINPQQNKVVFMFEDYIPVKCSGANSSVCVCVFIYFS